MVEDVEVIDYIVLDAESLNPYSFGRWSKTKPIIEKIAPIA